MQITVYTRSQIESMAPDAASLKAGLGLALPKKWLKASFSSHESAQVLWGECQGSGTKPYLTQIDLTEPAFKCSCPSRKFPCKHALGLLLLWSAEPDTVREAPAPEWVQTWIQSRAARQSKQTTRQASKLSPTAAQQDTSYEAAAESAKPQSDAESKRHAKVAAGLDDLKLWLEDLLRRGLVHLPQQPYAFFDQTAARLVDAQAPGLARRVRDLGSISFQQPDWPQQCLEQIGLIHLLIQAYERLDSLDPALQAEVKSQLGWTYSQEALLQTSGLLDQWLVLGQVNGVQDHLNLRRTWLWGQKSQQYALLLDFSFGGQAYKQHWFPGQVIQAELVWYPSSYPQRALIKPGFETLQTADSAQTAAYPDWQSAFEARARALAQNPWLSHLPMCVQLITPQIVIERLWLQDQKGVRLPVWQGFEQVWRLLALSGGHPVSLSLECQDERIYPLGVWTQQGYQPLHRAGV